MTVAEWLVFAGFWTIFVTSPAPNAVNCIEAGWSVGPRRAMWCVAAILTQASAFLLASAGGVAALLVTAPGAFRAVQLVGAAILIALGLRAWLAAGRQVTAPPGGRSLYLRSLAIATFNAKSVAGYLAAFTQFVATDVPIWPQMAVIAPTALTLTAAGYTGWVTLGAVLGRRAIGVAASRALRRVLALCFIGYGVALALL